MQLLDTILVILNIKEQIDQPRSDFGIKILFRLRMVITMLTYLTDGLLFHGSFPTFFFFFSKHRVIREHIVLFVSTKAPAQSICL